MTYHDHDVHSDTTSTANAGEAGAPGDEIEITPEMKRAGADFLDRQFCEGSSYTTGLLEHQASAIFRLMAALAPGRCTPGT